MSQYIVQTLKRQCVTKYCKIQGILYIFIVDVITREEFIVMNTMLLDSYLYQLSQTHPKHRQRYSDQIWLNQKVDGGIMEQVEQRYLEH